MEISNKDIARFWNYVDKSGECWIWTGKHGKVRGSGWGDYGIFSVRAKFISAHRASYIIEHGSIPEGKCICHKCDTPRCVRPEHLFAGTHYDNMRDCSAKGRNIMQVHPECLRGTKNGRSLLTESQVIAIREKHHCDVSERTLAKEYNVSRSAIHHIIKYDNWRYLK
jgi:hypothetical protein